MKIHIIKVYRDTLSSKKTIRGGVVILAKINNELTSCVIKRNQPFFMFHNLKSHKSFKIKWTNAWIESMCLACNFYLDSQISRNILTKRINKNIVGIDGELRSLKLEKATINAIIKSNK